MKQGWLPKRLEKIAREWLELRQKDIIKAWEDAQANKTPRRVKPIE
jgi:hypothetical protein